MACDMAEGCANFRKFPPCFTKNGWKICKSFREKGREIEAGGGGGVLKTLIKVVIALVVLYFLAQLIIPILNPS